MTEREEEEVECRSAWWQLPRWWHVMDGDGIDWRVDGVVSVDFLRHYQVYFSRRFWA
jgi:hypothetical protein